MIDYLEEILIKVFSKLNYNLEYAKISESKMKNLCDYQINSSFYLSKELHENPNQIAEKIKEELKKFEEFKHVSVLNGFINITVSDKYITDNIKALVANDFGIKKENKTTIVDYGGPNIAKPLHVGHLRTAIIGESIKRIFKRKGHNVIGDIHLGDYGLQIGQVIYGLIKENIDVNNISLSLLNRIYPQMSKLCKENEEVYDNCKRITKELQDGDKQYYIYWKKICEISINDIKELYNYLDVHFELWNGESDSYAYMDPLIKFLESKNVIVDDNNTKIIKVSNENDTKEMPPLILQKGDGAYLYATTDLATIYERIEKYNPDNILYVVDNRQSLHFEQVFRVSKMTGLSKNAKLEHDGFGTVNGLDGKPFKTREGGLFKLKDLIKETEEIFINKKEDNKNKTESDIRKIVNSIIKFADLQNNREKNYIFDINKFSDINGKTGPYILYSALRIKKLLSSNDFDKNITEKIYNEYDRNLRLELLNFSTALDKAFELRMPSYIAEYVYNLCSVSNAFYQNNSINTLEDIVNKNDWLFIMDLTFKIVEECLYLLSIEIPTEM